MMKAVILVVLLLGVVAGFISSGLKSTVSVSRLADSRTSETSFQLAELYSGPAARYNGELIMPGLKQVATVAQAPPAGVRYGDVSTDGLPALVGGSLFVVLLAAAVPRFLAIGESAQSQQRTREISDKSNPYNSFVNKAGSKKSVVVGQKKKAGTPVKAAPAPVKSSSPFSFSFGKKATAPVPKAAPAPVKKSSPFSLSFGKPKGK